MPSRCMLKILAVLSKVNSDLNIFSSPLLETSRLPFTMEVPLLTVLLTSLDKMLMVKAYQLLHLRTSISTLTLTKLVLTLVEVLLLILLMLSSGFSRV